MKARYIREARDVNPLFSNKEKRAAKLRGKTYDVEPYITIPVGFVEEGPLCWTHCCPGYMGAPPVCEPVDDECREKVRQWMEVERPKRLRQIQQMLIPSNLSKLPKKTQKHVQELAEAYGLTAPEAVVSGPTLTQDLPLEDGIKNALLKAGLNTVPKIQAVDDLTKVPNIGKESAKRIQEALAE